MENKIIYFDQSAKMNQPKITDESSAIEKFIFKSFIAKNGDGPKANFELSGEIDAPSKEAPLPLESDQVELEKKIKQVNEIIEEKQQQILKYETNLQDLKKENDDLQQRLQEQIENNLQTENLANLAQNLESEMSKIFSKLDKITAEISNETKNLILSIAGKISLSTDEEKLKQMENLISESLKMLNLESESLLIRLNEKTLKEFEKSFSKNLDQRISLIKSRDLGEFDFAIEFDKGKIEHRASDICRQIEQILEKQIAK